MSDRLNWLAGEVLEVLESEIGALYAAEKRERLLGLNRFEVLVWRNNLDTQMTIQTLRSL